MTATKKKSRRRQHQTDHGDLPKLATRLTPAAMPRALLPMLCTLVAEPFENPAWIFEPKYDGLRVLGRFDGREQILLSRNQTLQNVPFPDIVEAQRNSLTRPAIVDVDVMQNANGRHTVPPYVLHAVPGTPV